MLDYPALAAVAEIIRSGSFEGAAAALRVTPSAISQRVRALEDRMGTVLIDRGPPVAATAQGLRLAAHLDQVRLLESGLALSQDRPVLRLAVNADSLASWAMPALAAAPGLLDLTIDDQDHALDWLKGGRVVAALTSDSRAVTGCDSLRLGILRYRAVASPGFVARHFPNGVTAESLALAPSLCFDAKDALQTRWVQALTGRRVVLPMHRIPTAHGFAAAARLGIGWGMNPEPMIRDDLDGGRLIDLAPGLPLDVPLFWQFSRITAPALAPLTQAIMKAARAALLP
ncbi:ArgP/LysG family DNA-binding transcriptional regulator [Paracoccus sp. YIM 132242]|uniref:ArgP/LysG family DNA-binding transcriptional regulator n=1 Tax=Paracoccus lichenicola TaxID=2665644 RepID=A0A6L6HQC8_9RHOB|nr:LysR family transcriptional regulator ArgP [Paracoccus lichenicola]MTE01347.1 ArgP/LysG family DNA-binding transcriptional regulator [Paracoccus lichenicola]